MDYCIPHRCQAPAATCRLVFHRAWPDLQRMKLLLPGGAVLPGQFPPSRGEAKSKYGKPA